MLYRRVNMNENYREKEINILNIFKELNANKYDSNVVKYVEIPAGVHVEFDTKSIYFLINGIAMHSEDNNSKSFNEQQILNFEVLCNLSQRITKIYAQTDIAIGMVDKEYLLDYFSIRPSFMEFLLTKIQLYYESLLVTRIKTHL